MGKYDTLTKYIDELSATKDFGHQSESHHGYYLADIVNRFLNDYHDFAFGTCTEGKREPGFRYQNYDNIIYNAAKVCCCSEENIRTGEILYDAETTLAAMMWISRSEH